MFQDSQDKMQEDIFKAIEKKYFCLIKYQNNPKFKILFGLMINIKSYHQLIN
jgi:hypothetical protein